MSKDQMIDNIRKAVGRSGDAPIPSRPPVLPSRIPGTEKQEVELFISELEKLSASGSTLSAQNVSSELAELIDRYSIRKATIWRTPFIERLGIGTTLQTLGIQIIENSAGKNALADCDLGITEASYILPETGSIVLRASESMPRVTSLLPRVHLAIATPECLRADLAEVLSECKEFNYFVFISGPSRTADIEMTPALGVHGPRELIVWMMEDRR